MNKRESVLVGIMLSELVQVVTGWEQIEAGMVRGRRLTPWESERLNSARDAVKMAVKAGCTGNAVIGSTERQAVDSVQWNKGKNDRINGRGCLSANGSYLGGYYSADAESSVG
jgi:hypothetical protein